MAVKLIRHKLEDLSSLEALGGFLDYVLNRDHKNHKGIKLGEMQFFGCEDKSKSGFLEAVKDADRKYRQSLARKRHAGKRSVKLWEQIVFSTAYDANEHLRNKQAMEKLLVEKLCPDSACVLVPHWNAETGRLDEHLIFASKTKDPKPVLTLRNKFFGGRHFSKCFEELDKELTDALNRGVEQKLKTADEVHRERLEEKNKERHEGKKLVWNLAREIIVAGVERHSLRIAIEFLGGEVTRETKRNISVRWENIRRVQRYNKEKLDADIDAYLDGVFVGELLVKGKQKQALAFLEERKEIVDVFRKDFGVDLKNVAAKDGINEVVDGIKKALPVSTWIDLEKRDKAKTSKDDWDSKE